jgi:transcriptional regulator NrdR family protein
MLCPSCEERTKVLETRQFYDKDGGFYYLDRRRECLSCGERFFSLEIPRDVWQKYERVEDETD